jgi:hypothetical protein
MEVAFNKSLFENLNLRRECMFESYSMVFFLLESCKTCMLVRALIKGVGGLLTF